MTHRMTTRARWWTSPVVVLAVALLLVPLAGGARAAVPCESLNGMALADGVVISAVSVPGASFTAPDGQTYGDVPAFCRVSAVLTPTTDSLINVEVWLPTTTWNGRFEGVGNGGYGGSIAAGVPAMIAGLQAGRAVATTDMGTAPSANTNADLLVGHPQKWIDWGHRATHLMTVAAKAIIATHYGAPPRYSYFNGCSTGGQQGLMEAQRYHDDYDGILAGAPASNRTHVHMAAVWAYQATRESPLSYIPPDKVKLITDSLVAACAAKSGGLATDAFLTDPRRCDWEPRSIQCPLLDGPGCLTAAQVRAAERIYAGARNPVTGHQIVPGWVKGSEAASSLGWNATQSNPEVPFGSLFKWVFGPTWHWSTFDFDRDVETVDSLLVPMLNANDPTLDVFDQRGGKILLYTGWADPIVPPQDVINYYRRVVAAQGKNPKQALARTQSFFRLFMVPGMNHCAYGPGPNAFGNRFSATVTTPPAPVSDAAHDAMVALQEWVEHGVAPARIIATKYVSDQPVNGVQMTRPLCPYPTVARYAGSGDPNAASSFTCVASSTVEPPLPAPEYLD